MELSSRAHRPEVRTRTLRTRRLKRKSMTRSSKRQRDLNHYALALTTLTRNKELDIRPNVRPLTIHTRQKLEEKVSNFTHESCLVEVELYKKCQCKFDTMAPSFLKS